MFVITVSTDGSVKRTPSVGFDLSVFDTLKRAVGGEFIELVRYDGVVAFCRNENGRMFFTENSAFPGVFVVLCGATADGEEIGFETEHEFERAMAEILSFPKRVHAAARKS